MNDHEYVGVDISDAVNVARDRFTEMGLPGTFVQSDLKTIPEELGKFDVIFSEGVLHHTDSVKDAIAALAPRLTPEGYFLFYVYSKKAPIREFTDDYVREAISDMSDDEAWEALKPLTRLGKVLGDLDVEFEVPDDIPILGIEKGTYNLQRFFFYKICKAFYRPEYSEDEMKEIDAEIEAIRAEKEKESAAVQEKLDSEKEEKQKQKQVEKEIRAMKILINKKFGPTTWSDILIMRQQRIEELRKRKEKERRKKEEPWQQEGKCKG